MRGRPPIPAHLKLIRGNPGKRRIQPEAQPTITDDVPAPLAFLSEYARAEWERLAPELHRLRLLTVADLATFGAYCSSYARWRASEEMLAQMTDPDVMRVLTGLASQCARDMVVCAQHFGLTPVARTRIAAGLGRSKLAGKFDGLIA